MSRSKRAPLSSARSSKKPGANKAAAKKSTPKRPAAASRPGHSARALPPLTTSRKALLVDGSDHAFRQLVHSLLAFMARHETIRDGHAAAIGLAGIEYSVLMAVKHLGAGGDVSVRELAAHLHLSGAFVTTVSNRLQQAGLLDKLVDPADRRRLRLVVTAAGDARLAELGAGQCQVNDVQFDCLGAEDFHRLMATIDRLVESSDRAIALQRYLQPAAPLRGDRKPQP